TTAHVTPPRTRARVVRRSWGAATTARRPETTQDAQLLRGVTTALALVEKRHPAYFWRSATVAAIARELCDAIHPFRQRSRPTPPQHWPFGRLVRRALPADDSANGRRSRGPTRLELGLVRRRHLGLEHAQQRTTPTRLRPGTTRKRRWRHPSQRHDGQRVGTRSRAAAARSASGHPAVRHRHRTTRGAVDPRRQSGGHRSS